MQPEVAEIIFVTQQVEGENANNLLEIKRINLTTNKVLNSGGVKEAKDRDCSGRSVSVQHQDTSKS